MSSVVLADYVHFAQTTIAQRAGNVALSETLGVPAAAVQPLQAIARLDHQTAPTPARPRIDTDTLLEAVKRDPELLQAHIGQPSSSQSTSSQPVVI